MHCRTVLHIFEPMQPRLLRDMEVPVSTQPHHGIGG